jgi:hypothetical protein
MVAALQAFRDGRRRQSSWTESPGFSDDEIPAIAAGSRAALIGRCRDRTAPTAANLSLPPLRAHGIGVALPASHQGAQPRIVVIGGGSRARPRRAF